MSKSQGFTRQWLLAGTILTTLLVGMPAMAQDAAAQSDAAKADAAKAAEQTPPKAPESQPPADSSSVVITGSRIRNKSFTSAAPVQIITADKSAMSGTIDAAEVLQSSSVAAGSGQINSTFTGYVVNGGDGVNTLSLRGLGAQRSLILLNGRRMPPAGTSGTVGPVDLNTIPQAIVQRYEILTDGASSIYGSDAVAGVVNIITEKNYDGFQIQAKDLTSQKDGGDSYSISSKWGKTFDRGNVMVSGEYFEQKPLTLAQRPGLACPTINFYKADGSRGDRIDPRTNTYKCYSAAGVFDSEIRDNITGDIYFYAPGTNDPSSPIPNYLTYDGTVATSVYENDNPAAALNTSAISPAKRATLFATANYRPAFLNGAEFYSELLYSHRESEQTAWGELFPYYSSHSSVNPLPNTLPPIVNAYYGFGPKQPYAQPIVLYPSNSSQTVDVGRVLAGLRGDFGKWQWDTYLSYSENHGKYDNNVVYADRVNWGTGFDQVNFVEIPECGTGAPAGCVPLNLFSVNAQTKGQLTSAEQAYYFTMDHGKTFYSQMIAEGTLTGDLLQLPAGPLGTAVGFSFRQDKIDDLPGELSRAGNSYNRSSAGRTKGTDDLKEVFAEFEAPIIRGQPFFEDLTLNASGRYSDYKTVGSATTYKVGFNWAVDPTFRIRGTAGTSFRGPALYELFLKDQTGFLGQLNVDPCINYNQTNGDGTFKANATVRANCAADGIPGNYTGNNPSAVITTKGGSYLRPETSYATTLGFVLTPPDLGFKFAMDFWKIKIGDQITSSGAAVIGACYNSVQFRSQPGFCDSFTRDLGATSHTKYAILTIDGSYRNVPTEAESGIDYTLSYERQFNFGTLTSDWSFTYYKYDKQQLFPGAVVDNYTGLIGSQHWAGDIQNRFKHKDITVAWTINYIGDASNIGYYGETGLASGNRHYAASVPPFVTHDFDIRYQAKSFNLIVGLKNALDTYAPEIGSGQYSGSAARFGNYPFSSQYLDGYIGRQLYINVSKTF